MMSCNAPLPLPQSTSASPIAPTQALALARWQERVQLANRDAVQQEPACGPWHTFEVAFGRTVDPGSSLLEQGDTTLWMRGAKPKIVHDETDMAGKESMEASREASRSQTTKNGAYRWCWLSRLTSCLLHSVD